MLGAAGLSTGDGRTKNYGPMAVTWLARTLLAVIAAGACDADPGVPEQAAVHRPVRVPQPIAPADDDTSANLLQEYAARDPIEQREADLWELPFQSKRIVVALLITAGKDRLEDLDMLLTPDAMWGLPETRRFGARPIFAGDSGEGFLRAFRAAAARFPGKAKWQTQPLAAGPQEVVRDGAEPLWSFFGNGNDRIYFRKVMYGGHARIDYVGLFEELPTEPVKVVGHGKPVPLGPQLRHAPDAEPDADTDAARAERGP